MQSRVELAREYLEKRPSAAADVLETLPPADTTAFLAELPARISGNVLAAMHAHYAAHCMTGMSKDYLVNVLQHLSIQRGAALLRVLPLARQGALLNNLASHHARTLRFLLSYSNNLVGAWADPNAITIKPELTVGETRRRLQQFDTRNSQRLFLVDEGHQLKGSVLISALFQAQDGMAVQQLADPAPNSLRARTSLLAAEQHRSWLQYVEMPVIGRGDEFIGMITYQNIHQALQGLRRRSEARGTEDYIVYGLTDVYHAGLQGAWQTWMDLLAIPVEDRGVNDEDESGYHRGS